MYFDVSLYMGYNFIQCRLYVRFNKCNLSKLYYENDDISTKERDLRFVLCIGMLYA